MGLDSMYEVVQTLIYFFAGSMSIWVLNKYLNFGAAIFAMVLFALILYRFLFRADKHPIYLLLLIGMILGTLLGSLVTFLQVLIDPVEYLSLQSLFICKLYKRKSRVIVYRNRYFTHCVYLWLSYDG